MYKFLKIKNLFWILFFLGIIKFILIMILIFSQVYILEAKEKNTFSACPPEFIKMLSLEKAKFYEKNKEIELKEKELKVLESRIQEQMNALRELETSIEEKLNRLEAIQDERIKLLVKAVSEMRASKAAQVLINMDKDMAIKIMSQLKSTEIANILSSMPPEKAAELSSALSGYPPKEY